MTDVTPTPDDPTVPDIEGQDVAQHNDAVPDTAANWQGDLADIRSGAVTVVEEPRDETPYVEETDDWQHELRKLRGLA